MESMPSGINFLLCFQVVRRKLLDKEILLLLQRFRQHESRSAFHDYLPPPRFLELGAKNVNIGIARARCSRGSIRVNFYCHGTFVVAGLLHRRWVDGPNGRPWA